MSVSAPGRGAQLAAAVAAARAGGDVVRRGFAALDHAADRAREKAPGDWVSDVDTASEDAIRAVLREAFPSVAFLGEEEGGERAAQAWVVDPLDGTANFLHRFPVVGVSVALVEDGEPVVAVVHAPMLGDLFTATSGGGAWRGERRVSVSERPTAQAIVATGFPFRHKEWGTEFVRAFEAAFGAFEDLRRAGAASLDLAWTAAGVFDGFFELALGPWDVAAGALLVREAGGVVTDWARDPRGWLTSGDIVAGPRDVHDRLVALVGPTAERARKPSGPKSG